MVALLVLALLLGGMARIHGACLQACNRIHESLRLQRTLRLAQARLADDLRMAGYRYPLPGGRPWGDDPLEHSLPRSDEVSFLRDVPLEARAVLAAGWPGPGAGPEPSAAAPVWLRADPGASLQAGDLLVLEDGCFEWAEVAAPVTLPRRQPVAVALAPPGLRAAHAPGGRVALVRPRRMVRFAVADLSLEGASARVPCLVRFEAPLPPDGGVPDWAGLLAKPRTAPGEAAILAEQITAFRVEASPPGLDGQDHRIPRLLRVTLEARSALARPEYAPEGGGAAFLYRSLTCVLAPGKAALERAP
jgi:hypothetical protein